MPDETSTGDELWDRAATTAYPGVQTWLRGALTDARLDVASLRTRMHRCVLDECQGACCVNGAYLEQDEAAVLPTLVAEHIAQLSALGVETPPEAVVIADAHGRSKTATREHEGGTPPQATSCVLRLADGRCSMQVIAQTEGLHPWAYKPLVCWLHPLDIHTDGGRTVVGLFRGAPPPEGSPASVGTAPCSQREDAGVPAFELLAQEIRFLTGLSGRSLRTDP